MSDNAKELTFAFATICIVMAARLSFGQADGTHPGAAAQSGDASAAAMVFDVVSVKPIDTGGKRMPGFRYMPDGIQADATTVSTMVWNAYGGVMQLPTDDSVIGLPDWTKTDYYDVEAKMSAEQTAEFAKLSMDEKGQRMEALLQSLLADRFKMKAHRELKQVPDYELVVAKGGPKMKEGIDPNGPKDKDRKPMSGPLTVMRGTGSFQLQGETMRDLAAFLEQPFVGAGRIVKDKTGLTEKYSFTLSFAPVQGARLGPPGEVGAPTPAAADDSLPSIFTAVQEQLGLKLQPGTGMIDTLVIDHVERPSEN